MSHANALRASGSAQPQVLASEPVAMPQPVLTLDPFLLPKQDNDGMMTSLYDTVDLDLGPSANYTTNHASNFSGPIRHPVAFAFNPGRVSNQPSYPCDLPNRAIVYQSTPTFNPLAAMQAELNQVEGESDVCQTTSMLPVLQVQPAVAMTEIHALPSLQHQMSNLHSFPLMEVGPINPSFDVDLYSANIIRPTEALDPMKGRDAPPGSSGPVYKTTTLLTIPTPNESIELTISPEKTVSGDEDSVDIPGKSIRKTKAIDKKRGKKRKLSGETRNRRELHVSADDRDRRRVRIACVPCHKSKVMCEHCRPCKRCVRLGIQDQCVDRVHRKMGRPRKDPKKSQLSDSPTLPDPRSRSTRSRTRVKGTTEAKEQCNH